MPYKKCPACGHKNKVNSLTCENCNCDISTVEVIKEEKGKNVLIEEPKTIIEKEEYVEFLGEDFVIKAKDGDVIGRGMESVGSEYLQNVYISRKHIKVYFKEDGWYIEPLKNTTNDTYLNGEKLEKGKLFKIRRGDIVGLSTKVKLEVKIKR